MLLSSRASFKLSSTARRGGGLLSLSRRHHQRASSLLLSTSSHQQLRNATTIAILRETYDTWERRAPLSPDHVQQLLHELSPSVGSSSSTSKPGKKKKKNTFVLNPPLRVLVQPCRRRIFGTKAYEQAGAIVQEDVSEADILLGVKRPADPTTLLPKKAYVFFSHTIKGQPENMDLLQEFLDKKIQLLDYERMMKNNNNESKQGSSTPPPRRLVSFGRFAGMAGTIDSFHAMGRRLLYNYGMSTPFLSCAPAILNNDSLELAKDRVLLMGERIFFGDGGGIIDGMSEPLVIAVTGRGGCVHEGVMEILQLLPHEIVKVDDLPRLWEDAAAAPKDDDTTSTTTSANMQHHNKNKIYIVPVDPADIYERKDGKAAAAAAAAAASASASASSFERADFEQDPSQYRCTFADKVAPYMHVLINCIYWDNRFPRLLTKEQMRKFSEEDPDFEKRLLLVSDISCDVHGSIEFLERTCSIEKPFFQYDPIEQRETGSDIGPNGITVMGTDILPSELPRESSEHFGSAVLGVVRELVAARKKRAAVVGEDIDQQHQEKHGVDVSLLSPGLSNACITKVNGALEDDYRYLGPLMHRAEKSKKAAEAASISEECTMELSLVGHLFDSGLINQVLDVIERHDCGLDLRDCYFPTHSSRQSTMSSIVLHITSRPDKKVTLDLIENEIQTLVNVFVKANATMKRLSTVGQADNDHQTQSRRPSLAQVTSSTADKRVLVLGAGFVAKSTVDLLGRSTSSAIKVASDREEDARLVAKAAERGSHVVLDAENDPHRLSEMINEADVVVSLLPAPMHPAVARECILSRAHLVTASYESQEMRAMKGDVEAAGLVFLNEVGLDPGLDHMSAMKIVHDVQDRGGTVTSFSSVCGGLPAPDFADNPLGYKFSWSPKGVIRASLQGARYRWEDRVMQVQEGELLESAAPFLDAWPDLKLEVLPNRDSLAYEKVYGIEQGIHSMFRGTLRYRGFSAVMSVLQNMGLLDATEHHQGSWAGLIQDLGTERGFNSLDAFVLASAEGNVEKAEKASEALEWLDLLGSRSPSAGTVVDAFSDVLEERLRYKEDEFDMVAMHHTIDAVFEDGTEERHLSSLQVFGDQEKGSAMSKTVGFTTAACVEQILTGSLQRAVGDCGLILPTRREIYEPVLAAVAKEGIRFEEKLQTHSHPEVQEG